ncbi:hypothetical protein FIBSPDRAFT_382561 [Athelia psychrophila]|uniref:C3H1-type domain-containing protein n=1 Tax=Athelia psychrophila TaxID=1759441 RepID=A0A167V9Z9_9AGAM|nr:hypothetical protein FIBSPDRAFT_382561 [Fibularhizoctonia sp. CBS 109695]
MSMASEGPPGKPQVAVLNNRTPISKRNNETKLIQSTDNLKLDGQCRFGHCKLGDLCKRSHGDPLGEVTTNPTAPMPTNVAQIQVPHRTSSTPVTSSNVPGQPTTSSASTLSRPNAPTTTLNASPGAIPKEQAKKLCFSWAKSGTCQFGSKYRNDHDVNVRRPLSIRSASCARN